MAALSICGGETLVAIEGTASSVALSLVIDIIGSVRASGSNTYSKSPMPDGTTVIDHAVRQPDKLSFDFIVGCRDCRNDNAKLLAIIPALKNIMSEHIYTTNFLNIVWNDGFASNMLLQNWRTRKNEQSPQIVNVSLDFIAANIQGEIGAPSFQAGGFLGI